jgi:hypothetical protein
MHNGTVNTKMTTRIPCKGARPHTNNLYDKYFSEEFRATNESSKDTIIDKEFKATHESSNNKIIE